MVITTLARKDFRLLIRDPRAVVILLAMPLIFIAILGVALDDNFGHKPADRLKVSVVIEDEGPPRPLDRPATVREGESWAETVLHDLRGTADISVEVIATRAEAETLVRTSKRPAVLVLGKNFSKRVARCSFLSPGWKDGLGVLTAYPMPGDPVAIAARGLFDERQTALPLYLLDGINPFHREGMNYSSLDVELLRDPTQQTSARIIDQVAQVSLMRVVMPWMIGRAFEKISDPQFLDLLGGEKNLPGAVKVFLNLAPEKEKKNLSVGLQGAIQNLFPKYNLTAKTWEALTRSKPGTGSEADLVTYQEDGSGLLRRGSSRYQILVPSYLVMFAFFLVLTVGWLIVAERRQGTLKRLSLAPVSRAEILLGKLLPCLAISIFQGVGILVAGKLLFGMSWGAEPGWLVVVVLATSFAAMGLALLVASLARTETQVAIYGTLLVLVLAGLSGCLMGDRAMMPERMQQVSLVTPHAWALDAYRQLLTNPTPEMATVATACGALVAFGVGFLALAWFSLRWE